MKKLVAILLLALTATTAMAQHHGYRHGHGGYWHRGYGGGWTWVAPTIIGGVIGYEIARNQPPVIVQQPPVVYTPPVYSPPPAPVVQAGCTRYVFLDQSGQTVREEVRCN